MSKTFDEKCAAIQRWLDFGATVYVTNCYLGHPTPENAYMLKIEPPAKEPEKP